MSKKTWFGAFAVVAFVSTIVSGCGSSARGDLVVSAKEYVADGNYQAALIQLKNALAANPSLAEARFLLGQVLFQTGDSAGAEIELRRAKSLGYPEDEVNIFLSRALIASRAYRKVVDEFGDVHPSRPEDQAVVYTAVAQAFMGLRAFDQARAKLNAALTVHPTYAPALLSSAYLKAGGGDLKAAMALVDRAVASSPKVPEVHQFKGDLLLAEGKSEEALASYRKAVQVKADYVPAHSALVSLLAQRGELERAREQLKALQKVAAKDPRTVYLRALLSYQEKDLSRARETIQEQLIMAPENVPGLVLAGAIELDLKSFAQSEAYLRRALEKAPNHNLARHLLVTNYLRTGQADKAIDAVGPLVKIAGNRVPTLALAGEVYLVNGQADEAMRYFERALKLAPEHVASKTGVGLSYIAQGDVDRGYRELAEAAANSKETTADLALIAAYLKQREFDKALAAIAKLEKKQPDEAMIHNLRGVAFLGKSDRVSARRSFERAVALDPAYFPAVENLAKLDVADGKLQDAKRLYEAVIAKNKKNSRAFLALANLKRLEKSTSEEVVALIRQAVAADPTDSLSRIVLIDQLVRDGDAAAAVTAAQDALNAIPDRPELLDAAARAQLAAGSRNQALALYAKWAQLDPGSYIPLLRLAEIQLVDGAVAAAEKNLRKALELKPDFLEAQRRLIALELERNRIAEAIALAQQVQKQRPKEAAGYILEGDINAKKNNWASAITVYRKGLRQTDSSELAARLHAALRADGRRAEAEQLAAERLTRLPNDLIFRSHLADSALALSEYREAIKHYEALLAVQPNNAGWLNNLAWAAAHIKDPRAIEYAEKAVSLAPSNANILDTLGTLLVEKGESARGLQILRKAASLAPKSLSIRLNLAKGLLAAGEKAAAKRELEQLSALGKSFPRHAEVEALLRQL